MHFFPQWELYLYNAATDSCQNCFIGTPLHLFHSIVSPTFRAPQTTNIKAARRYPLQGERDAWLRNAWI